MMLSVRMLLRWALSALLVTLPASYLLWQWRSEEHEVLTGLSYENFHTLIADESPGSYWTYFLYALAAITCVNVATALLAWILGRIFPDEPVRIPKAR